MPESLPLCSGSRLRLVGFGINGFQQFTLEGIQATCGAVRVLYLGASGLFAPFLDALGIVDAASLDHLYVDGAVDQQNYDRIASRVVEELAERKDVAVLFYGHPRVGVSLVPQLEARLASSGVTIDVICAPSSLDLMINDLRRDPLERGTVVLDVNRLLLFEFALEPALDHYLYHVCSVGMARTMVRDPSIGNRLDLVQRYLLQFFPATHPVTLISSAVERIGRSELTHGKVGRLHELLPFVTFSSTLFVPGIKPRTVNRDFLALLTTA